MIETIARRAGGFASTTAFRWLAAARDAAAESDVVPVKSSNGSHRGPAVAAGAVALAAAALSTKKARTAAESTLRGLARTMRTEGKTTQRAASNGKAATNGAAAELGRKTRAELYELAKKADLPGRSTMSKEDLARALKG